MLLPLAIRPSKAVAIRLLGTLALLTCLVGIPTDCASESSLDALNLLRAKQTRGGSQLQVAWRSVPLAKAVARLEAEAAINCFMDRRIDPGKPITISATGLPTQLLARIGEADTDIAVSEVGSVTYLGPASVAAEITTLALRAIQRVESLPATSRKRYYSQRGISWQRASEPRNVLAQLCQERRIEIKNPQQLPYDLWPTGRLPKGPVALQLTLLLVGFDLDWRPLDSGRAIELIPINRPIVVSASYRLKAPATATLAQLAPPLRQLAKRQGDQYEVTGTAEQHLQIAEATQLVPKRRSTSRRNYTKRNVPSLEAQRITLTVKEQPLGALLQKLAESFQLFLAKPALAQAQRRELMNRRVSLSVQQSTLSETLELLAEQTGSDIVIEHQTIKISVGKKSR